jgi:hypothetical protein
MAARTPGTPGMSTRRRNHTGPHREDPPRKGPPHIGPAPTLADLKARDVCELMVWCGAWPQRCFHRGVVPLANLDLTQTIADVTPRLVCTKCGLVGGYAQPRWP